MRRRIAINNRTQFSKRDLRKISTGVLREFADDGLNWTITFSYGRDRCSGGCRGGSVAGIGNRNVQCKECANRLISAMRDMPYRDITVLLPKTEIDLPKEVSIRVALAIQECVKAWYSTRLYFVAGEEYDSAAATRIVGDTEIHFEAEQEMTSQEKKCHRENRARLLLGKWQKRLKMANTKIKKLKRTIAYYEKQRMGTT